MGTGVSFAFDASRGKRHEPDAWQPAPPGWYCHVAEGEALAGSYATAGQYMCRCDADAISAACLGDSAADSRFIIAEGTASERAQKLANFCCSVNSGGRETVL